MHHDAFSNNINAFYKHVNTTMYNLIEMSPTYTTTFNLYEDTM